MLAVNRTVSYSSAFYLTCHTQGSVYAGTAHTVRTRADRRGASQGWPNWRLFVCLRERVNDGVKKKIRKGGSRWPPSSGPQLYAAWLTHSTLTKRHTHTQMHVQTHICDCTARTTLETAWITLLCRWLMLWCCGQQVKWIISLQKQIFSCLYCTFDA